MAMNRVARELGEDFDAGGECHSSLLGRRVNFRNDGRGVEWKSNVRTVIEAMIANGTSLDEVRTSSARVSSNEDGAIKTNESMHMYNKVGNIHRYLPSHQ